MKCLIVFAAVLAVSSAQLGFGGFARQRPLAPRPPPSRPVQPAPRPQAAARASASDRDAVIVRYDNDISPDGSYSYAFETDNGIAAQAQGTPRDFGGNPPLVADVVQGSFSWTSPEGQPIGVAYTADENGYQATGDAIPTPHPVPEYILRSLDYIAKNAPLKKK